MYPSINSDGKGTYAFNLAYACNAAPSGVCTRETAAPQGNKGRQPAQTRGSTGRALQEAGKEPEGNVELSGDAVETSLDDPQERGSDHALNDADED